MAVKNQLAKPQNKQTFSTYITGDAVKQKINQMIGGKDGQRFITAIISAVSTNPELAACDHGTILSAALLGESLKLSPSPQLGQYYLVPFDDNKNGRKVATFVLGYKGYIQLAIRSGYYRNINVLAIKEGELVRFNPLDEEIEVNLIENDLERENAVTIGYYAMFEYRNGFKKAMYWSREKMEAHALKYSKGYAADKKKGTKWTFWSKDFDGMATKTMVRQLISKWGIMTIDMQTAYEGDAALVHTDGTYGYVDTIETAEAPEPLAAAADDDQTKDDNQGSSESDAVDDFFAGTAEEEYNNLFNGDEVPQ